MSIPLNDNLGINAPKPSDSRYYDGLAPWASVATANAGIPAGVRYKGLTVNINGVEYWYATGILDADLVLKQVVNITYANLVTAIGASTLSPGTWYRITDYATKHKIPDTSPAVINTGAVEIILVQAYAVNKISGHAISETFPTDLLEYNYALNLCEDGTTARNGLITWRRDMVNSLECFYDWRKYKFRRYSIATSYVWDELATYAKGAIVTYDDGDTDMIFYCHTAVTVAGTPPINALDPNWIPVRQNINAFPVGTKIGITTPTLNTAVYTDYLTFNSTCVEVYCGPTATDNVFVSKATSIRLEYGCIKNTFQANPIAMTLISSSRNNIGITSKRIFLKGSSDNIFLSGAFDIELYAGANVFGDAVAGIKIMSSAIQNIFCESSNNMFLGVSSHDNVFRNSADVFFDTFCWGNYIKKGYSLTMRGQCNNNYIDGEYITLGMQDVQNTIIGNQISLGYGCQDIIFGLGSLNNVVGYACETLTFPANTINNTIKDQLTSVDFSAGTHIKGAYHCDIQKNSAGVARLIYLDASDNINVVDPTA